MYIFDYDKMKEKYQKEFNKKTAWLRMLNVLISMFKWENLPDTVPAEFLETYLITNGTAGFQKIGNEYLVGMGGYQGDMNPYNIGKEYMAVIINKPQMLGTVNKDICVAINNYTRTPDFDIVKYSTILSEIDTSEKINVLFSRMSRIPKVGDEKERIAIINSIKAIQEGKVDAVVSKNIMQDLINGNSNTEFLDLVDVKDIDKLQYLNQYYDNIFKRFCTEYGISYRTTSKLAQQTESEARGNDVLSMTYPLVKLKCRQRFCDEVNAMYGLNISCNFSECWSENYDSLINYNKNEKNEKEVIDNGNENSTSTQNNSESASVSDKDN